MEEYITLSIQSLSVQKELTHKVTPADISRCFESVMLSQAFTADNLQLLLVVNSLG